LRADQTEPFGLRLPGDEQLVADLVAPRYTLDSQGRRAVEAKAETKRRLGRSPDRADAVLLTLADGRGSYTGMLPDDDEPRGRRLRQRGERPVIPASLLEDLDNPLRHGQL
jgi:hypothetical protein